MQVLSRDGRPAAIYDRGQMIDIPEGLASLPLEQVIARLIGDHADGAEPRADLVRRVAPSAQPTQKATKSPDVEAMLAEADQLDAKADAERAPATPFEQDVVHVTTPEGEAGIRSQGFDVSRTRPLIPTVSTRPDSFLVASSLDQKDAASDA